jgi:hypothetical protein
MQIENKTNEFSLDKDKDVFYPYTKERSLGITSRAPVFLILSDWCLIARQMKRRSFTRILHRSS